MLKAFCGERVGKALDRLSHIRHTSTVFTVFHRLQKVSKQTKKSVQGTHLEIDTLPCLVVESRVWKEERKSVSEKDLKRSAEKNL